MPSESQFKNTLDDFVRIYRTCEANIRLYPDAEVFLEKRHSRRFAVLTNGGIWTQGNKCRLLRLDRFFEKICITGRLPKNQWKPAREAFEWFCREMDVEPEECLYVGDHLVNDYYGAVSAGLRACLIDREDRYCNAPVVRVRDFHDLEEYLAGTE